MTLRPHRADAAVAVPGRRPRNVTCEPGVPGARHRPDGSRREGRGDVVTLVTRAAGCVETGVDSAGGSDGSTGVVEQLSDVKVGGNEPSTVLLLVSRTGATLGAIELEHCAPVVHRKGAGPSRTFSASQRLKMAARLLRWSRMSLNMAAASPPARVAGSKMAPRARRRWHTAAFAASKYNSLRPSLKSAPVFVAAS
ncbi:hypothetical protein HPB52_021018 [Rhipicephalus sanguineus]|uniref:Uncharacterized protein n=1 Tax=Rhipicephalus sanguineus TaxID=34632 RepID=A0A9D4T4D3_RHISA|nr:hypothetical protein HPB52_021018 [Rhipicephalus sanguineus]